MTHLGYLLAGWGISLGVLAFYAVSVIQRGKKLATQVPSTRQRWMTADDGPSDPGVTA